MLGLHFAFPGIHILSVPWRLLGLLPLFAGIDLRVETVGTKDNLTFIGDVERLDQVLSIDLLRKNEGRAG